MNAKTQYDNGMSSIAGAQVGMSLTPKLCGTRTYSR